MFIAPLGVRERARTVRTTLLCKAPRAANRQVFVQIVSDTPRARGQCLIVHETCVRVCVCSCVCVCVDMLEWCALATLCFSGPSVTSATGLVQHALLYAIATQRLLCGKFIARTSLDICIFVLCDLMGFFLVPRGFCGAPALHRQNVWLGLLLRAELMVRLMVLCWSHRRHRGPRLWIPAMIFSCASSACTAHRCAP